MWGSFLQDLVLMDREAIQERFGITGSSPAIQHVVDRVHLVARTEISVLIQGESGVGKELIAHAIHELSGRRHNRMIIVNCGAIPEGLIESELFGNEKGAYTGAAERRSGYFEEADGGTLFLDEIGEMPLAAQVKLLRVLETGEFNRVGSSVSRKSDVRVIAATNKDLGKEVRAGRFREDLYYRLSTVIINIPPLRERKEDILPIFETFLYRFAQKYDTPMKRLDESARRLIVRYHWPGNVRELRNVAEQLVVLVRRDTVSEDDVRTFLRGVSAMDLPQDLVPVSRAASAAGDSPDSRERELVYRALLELRLEMRELKQQITNLASQLTVVRSREMVEHEDYDGRSGELVIVRDAERADYPSIIEDVPYEIAGDDEHHAVNGNSERREADKTDHEDPLPTLEGAERQLINEALRRFDGNRRQTAKALGISERTLYRKLKELEEGS